MIRANIPFVKGNFYNLKQKNEKVTGYEIFFQVLLNFRNRFNYSIRSFSKQNEIIEFSFVSPYGIRLKENYEEKYIELHSNSNNIEDFVEKFNYLEELVREKLR